MHMKYVANSISISRIILSILLLFVNRNAMVFISVYILCGISDVLDGYIARKTNTQSSFGAIIDSIADLVMFSVIIILMLVWLGDTASKFLPLLFTIVFIRLLNLIYTKYKYNSFVLIHTWGNKITGFLVFFIPISYVILHSTAMITIVCVISIVSSIEESIIHITSKELDLNRISIFK